jgi:predicted MPP superfamily phosphohydrolase
MPLWLRVTLFSLFILAITILTSLYVFRRGARVLGLERRGRIALAATLVLAPLAVILGRALEDELGPTASFAMGAFGMTIALGVVISTVLLAVADLPFLGMHLWNRLTKRKQTEAAKPSAPEAGAPERETVGEIVGPSTFSRREMIRRGAAGTALTVGFGSAIYGTLLGRHDYEITEIPVRIPGLSPHLDGYRIAQLSDIHFGVYVGEPELRSAVSLVRSARPDLVVLTGDVVDHDPAFAPFLGQLITRLRALPIRDGVTIIPGNHDYYTGIDVVLGTASTAGARVLRNTARAIGDRGGAFALVGVDDVWAPRNGFGDGPDLDRALAMVSPDLPRVLLCHNPEFFPEAQGKVALQLSGHTHGGQVNVGITPAHLVLPYVQGIYDEGGSRLYVNRGFGTAGPPSRVGAPPEVTVVVLTAA